MFTVSTASSSIGRLGSFSIDDGDGNDNDTKKQIDWSSGKISVLHVWHALMNKSVLSSAKQKREITMFTV